MISFVTLFLGLILGVRPVEVSAGAGVTSVDLILDGRLVVALAAPPWRAPVDFGTLQPHLLVAIARGPSGAEVGRASQRINLPRAQAEASLVLLPGAGGRDRVARLAWASAIRAKPLSVRVALDGVPVATDDPSNIALPRFAPGATHVLRAELSFPDDVIVSTELVFTGAHSDAAQSELTAVPAIFRGRVPRESAMDGWFQAGGQPVNVVAVDEGSGDIVVVRDEPAAPPLRRIKLHVLLDRVMEAGQRIWFCWPATQDAADTAPGYDVFPISHDYSPLHWLRRILVSAACPIRFDRPRLADAVAVAGLWAAAKNNRRAVLLIHAGSDDVSHLGAEAVRRYLAHRHATDAIARRDAVAPVLTSPA